MNVKGIPDVYDLKKIAAELQVQLYNLRRERNDSLSFVLRPLDRDRWRRKSASPVRSRRIWAVCFHGHYAFMRRVFELNPSAEIRTSMARYLGQVDFERKALGVGERNIGNPYNPVSLEGACFCGGAAAGGIVMPEETPWSDCKVAYGIDDADRFWRWIDRGTLSLPDGWEACETDCAGARCVAVFRVDGYPTYEDGERVRKRLAELERKR